MADNDPCDEIVSDVQITDFVGTRFLNLRFSLIPFDPHSVAASIWGIPREEAKRRVYAVAYRVVSPRGPVRERVDGA